MISIPRALVSSHRPLPTRFHLFSPFFLFKNIFTILLYFCSLLLERNKCLLYSVLLVSAMQHREPVVCVHVFTPFWIPFPFGSPETTGRVPCTTQQALLGCLFYTWLCVFVSSSLAAHPTRCPILGVHKFVLYVCVCSYFANKVMCTIFLDSTDECSYTVFVFLFLTYFTLMSVSRSLHISANGTISFLFPLFFLTLSYFFKLSLCLTSSSLVHCFFFFHCEKQLYSFCPQGSFILTCQGSCTHRI